MIKVYLSFTRLMQCFIRCNCAVFIGFLIKGTALVVHTFTTHADATEHSLRNEFGKDIIILMIQKQLLQLCSCVLPDSLKQGCQTPIMMVVSHDILGLFPLH